MKKTLRRNSLSVVFVALLGLNWATQTAFAQAADSPPPADVKKQIDELKQRIDQLEQQLNKPKPTEPAAQAAGNPAAPAAPGAPAPSAPGATPVPPTTPPVDLETPFAFGDFTWMNAVPRNHDSVFDG